MAQKKVVWNTGTPEAEVEIDTHLLFRLLTDQHPDLTKLPITLFDSGWDNMMFKLGEELCIRIPRRQLAAALILNEQKWLPELAKNLPLRVSAPCRTGTPTVYYPWHWSILPWIDGKSADEDPLRPTEAHVLGKFLKALHVDVPADFPKNPYREIPLSQLDQKTRERTKSLGDQLGTKENILLAKWEKAVTAITDTSPKIIHGDLHPQNILSRNGCIAAIIDWGDMTGGDIATDLASAWMLFGEPGERNDFFAAYGEVSDNTLYRAEGWAIYFGTILLYTGIVNNRRHEALGRTILRNVLR